MHTSRAFAARCLGTLAMFFLTTSSSEAALIDWQAAVASGTTAGYTNTNITSPIVADIGTYDEATGGGISYEFIVNATNDGVSSALIGTFENPPAVGDPAGLKWEQWPDTGVYGTTVFGVVDNLSTVANTPGVDTHIVFLNNGTDTALFVNGLLAGSIPGTPTIAGTVGIGQVYNPAGAPFDPLTGTIIGVAVYDNALSANEIYAHATAYFAVPEPSTAALAVVAMALFGRIASWRRAS